MNFTAVDVLGTLKACVLLAPFMVAPGYAIGWAFDLFEFRERRPLLQGLVAIPLSIALCPIISYLLARFAPPAMWAFYGSATVVSLVLLTRRARTVKQRPSKHVRIAFALVALWGVVAIASLVDLQIGRSLYLPVSAFDHSTRVALMASISRHMPPTNPFFAHPAVPLRYHYLWLLLCSLPMRVFPMTAPHLMYAGVVWCGLGLMCAVGMGLRFLMNERSAISAKTLIAIALLAVTGLDILPTLYVAASQRTWLADMEWWNEVQITSWADSLLWVPHNVAALIACAVCFMLLRHTADRKRWSTASVMVGGCAFASAAGLSVYVTFTFAVAIAFWIIALVARKHWQEPLIFAAAGFAALVFATPYLSSLGGPGSGTAFVELALRPFPLAADVAGRLGLRIQTPAELRVLSAALLPLNYALELGFFAAVGLVRIIQLRRKMIPANAQEQAAWSLVLASFVVGTFLRSSTITTNDLGIRCFLPAQFILLLWGANTLHDWLSAKRLALRGWAGATLATLLVLGMIGTSYELFMLRISPVLRDRWQMAAVDGWIESDGQAGKRMFAVRSAYEALNTQLPPSAVIQHNPLTESPVAHTLYSGHDAAAGGPDCGTAFGGDPRACEERVRRLAPLFQGASSNFESTCRAYNLDVVVAQDTDAAWKVPSWVWNQRPMYANEYVRAFACPITTATINHTTASINH